MHTFRPIKSAGASFLLAALALLHAAPMRADDAPAQPPAQTPPAQAAPAQDAANDAPIVPDVAFPSVMVLDSQDKVWSLMVTDKAQLKVNGNVIVNSPNGGALWTANSSIDVNNGNLNVVGGWKKMGPTMIQPAPMTGAGIAEDPIPDFKIPAPDRVISREKLFLTADEQTDTMLRPGIYSGGIFATGKGHIVMRPGTYVMNNGDFYASGPQIEGEGVTIVMAGNQPGGFSCNFGAGVKLSAPTTGALKNVLIVSRAGDALGAAVSLSSTQGKLTGLIYAPRAAVIVSNDAAITADRIICFHMTVQGGGKLEVTGALGDKGAAPPTAGAAPATPATGVVVEG